MTRLLPIALLLCFGFPLAAQELPFKFPKPIRTIWVGAGWSNWSFRDDAYAPGAVFRSGVATVRIGHMREQGQWLNFTEGMVGIGRLHTMQEAAFDSLLLPVKGPVIQVGSTHKGMQMRDLNGMRYRSSMTLIETLYYPRYVRPGLAASSTISSEMAFEPTQRRGATLSLRLSIPLLGWITRWQKDDAQPGKYKKVRKLSGMKSLQSANLSLHGQYFFNQSLSAGFQWRLTSLTYKRGDLLKMKEDAWYVYVAGHY